MAVIKFILKWNLVKVCFHIDNYSCQLINYKATVFFLMNLKIIHKIECSIQFENK